MTDTSKCLRAYAVGDEDVTNGSVENYDLDWGEPVTPPDCGCSEGCESRCGCNCQTRCGCAGTCGCETGPDPEPDPGECTDNACGCTETASNDDTYPILDL